MNAAVLDDEIGSLAGQLHAATASFVDMVSSFDVENGWAGVGMRSCAHWLTVVTGFDLGHAREMLRVGHSLRVLPLIHEAFASGRLSFDKVRLLCWVAQPQDEALWLDMAIQASGSQLGTIVRQFRRSIASDDPKRAALQRARRRVVSWWLDEDGMLALYAVLPPEEGRLVMSAIEAAVRRPVATAHAEADAESSESRFDPCAEDAAEHPHGALRADALVRVCEQWLRGAATSAAPRAGAELVVHVDADVLNRTDTGGRCHLDGGPALSVAAARRLGCDATVVTVLERDGVPLDVGRGRRVVSGGMRRLLQLRDQGCRYPGCTVPAADTEAHHVVHWVEGGRTDMANLVSLCRFHHHRHHEGAFRMVAPSAAPAQNGNFRFETAEGRTIAVRATGGSWHGSSADWWPRAATTPLAQGGGGGYDLDHTIAVLAGNRDVAARRAALEVPG